MISKSGWLLSLGKEIMISFPLCIVYSLSNFFRQQNRQTFFLSFSVVKIANLILCP